MALLASAGMMSALVASPASAATSRAAAPRAITTTNLGYTSLAAPVRIADTRTGATDPATYAGKTLAPGASLTIDLPSADVPAGAGAVVAQLTAITPTLGGYLAAYPAGGSTPTTASVNFVAGQIVGNMVTVGIGTDSSNGDPAVSIYNGPSGNTDFTLDLYGYYAAQTSTSGAAYVPMTPTRIVDTRAGSGYAGAGQTLGAGDTLQIPVTGLNGVPANATAVAVNIAVVNTTAPSYIQSYPTGSPPSSTTPTVNMNWLAGEVLSTKAIVGIGTGGDIDVYNAEGSTDVVIDLDGYFTAAGGTGSLFNALASPVRLADTRPTAVAASGNLPVTVAGANGIPSTATAGVLNITDLANGPNYLTAYPAGQSVPTAADVNYTSGDTSNIVGNASYATTGTGGVVDIFNSTSSANIVVDAFGYFAPPVTSGVTVTASPATLNANGTSTSAITVTVTHAGSAVSGDPVSLSTSASVAGSCGTFTTANPATTNGSGVATFTYKSSTTAGACTITATEADNAQSGTTIITQSVQNSVTFSPLTATLAANGTADQAFTVTVDGPAGAGAPVAGDALTFTTSANPSGACGSVVTNAGTTTNSSGQVAATYVTSTTVGFCTITATEQATSPGTGQSGSAPVDQTTTPVPTNHPYAVTVAASPATLQATGTSTSTVTVTVKDSTAAVVAGDPVNLSTVGTPAAACGTLSATSGTTSATGTVTVTYTSSTTGGAGDHCTITAQEASDAQSGSTPIAQTATNSVAVTATPTGVPANGSTTSAISVTVTNATGGAVTADPVTLTTSGSPALACGTITTANPTNTNSSGVAAFTYKASTTSGFCTITATETTGGQTGTVLVDQTSLVTPTSITVTATPSTVPATVAAAASTITATVEQSGTAISGDIVSFATSGTPTAACGALSASSATTNGAGVATVTYTSTATGGTCKVTATEADAGLTGNATITQSTNNTVVVTSSNVAADGTSTTSVTTTVTGPTGADVSGDAITLTPTASPAGACGSFTTSGNTNALGVLTETYVSSKTVGFCSITATEADTSQSGTGVVDQTTTPAPANVPYVVTVGASPASLQANGTSTSAITVTVKDSTAALVAGDPVILSTSGTPSAACGTLNTTTGTTSALGTVTVTYKANGTATAGNCVITAQEASDAKTGSTTIAQTINNSVLLAANPLDLNALTMTSALTVTVTGPTGAAISGDPVTFNLVGATCGTLSPTGPYSTNSSGVVTVTYTAGLAVPSGDCTITATETNTAQPSNSVIIVQTATL
jgi:adhesin/invasin